MLHVNDDMDELFRKAAEEYPLNTNGGNFDKVLSRLANTDTTAAMPVETKKGRDYRPLLLLLLIPLGWICNELSQPNNTVAKLKTSVAEKPVSPLTKAPTSSTDQVQVSSPTITKRIDNSNHSVKPDRALNDGDRKFAATTNADYRINKQTQKTTRQSTAAIVPGGNENKKQVALVIDETVTASEEKNNALENTSETSTTTTSTTSDTANTVAKTDNTPQLKQEASIAATSPALKNARKKVSNFYAGMVGGLDISTIKFQSVKDHGFNAGILAGYQLTKRLSIEASAFFVEKYYYSEAKHFDNTKARLPYFIAVKTIEGECEMIELALNGKYDFITNAKRRWYAIAGTSSLLMKSEYYSYKYVSSTTYYRHAEYNNKSTHLFSTVNLGVGFERSITNKLRVRVEPYFKLPLSGVGIGSMPITSTGINLGITRRF